MRLYYLRQPMRYDEAVTYLEFASQSWSTTISSYPYPSNHVFHSVLVKVCVTMLGNDPWVLRLPAFVAGVAMIPLTFSLGRRLVGPVAAYVGTALVACSGALALYSTNARGYTIVCAATLMLANLLVILRDRSSSGLWVASVAVTSLGMWTVPVMLFPAGGLALWFVLSALRGDTTQRRADLIRFSLGAAAIALVTLLLYSPIVARDGFGTLIGNSVVAASPWRVFFAQLASSIGDVLGGLALGFPLVVAVLLGASVVVGVVDERRVTGMRVSIVGSVYVWCALTLLVTHRVPFPRVWLFLLAPAALLAAHGMTHLVSRLAVVRDALASWAGAISVMVAMAGFAVVILSRDVVTSRDTGTFRDAEQVATGLAQRLRPGDRIIAPLPSNAPLAYHFVRAGIDLSFLSATPSDTSRVYLIVNTGEGFTLGTRLSEPLMQRFDKAQLIASYPAAEIYRLY